jgi:hypothetical protein
MRETLDIETVLRTAVDKIYQALGLDELEIYLAPQAPASSVEPSVRQNDGAPTAISLGGNHA